VDLVRPALVAHSGVTDVVRSGLWFLTSLSVNQSNRQLLLSNLDLVSIVRSLPPSPRRDDLLARWSASQWSCCIS
jgi:hypothetical protein